MQLSIIIPTLNEEQYLPRLLESVKNQTIRIANEIIVADAGSTDGTIAIANTYGCKVVKGGLPARGRNAGVAVAEAPLLLFLDADITLPPDFLEKGLAEMRRRSLSVAGVQLALPNKFQNALLHIFYNIPILFLEHLLPHGAMAIFVEKQLFEQVGGFDETIKLAEDMYFVRQAAKKRPFGILRSTFVVFSTRRYQKDGFVRTYGKYVFAELHMVFVGPVRSNIVKYQFGYSQKNAKKDLS